MNDNLTNNRIPVCPKCGSGNVVADVAAAGVPRIRNGRFQRVRQRPRLRRLWRGEHRLRLGRDFSGPTLTGAPKDDRLECGTLSAPEDPASYRYRVTWSIDVEADSRQDAAVSARSAQLEPNSIATNFTVGSHDGSALCIDTDDLIAASQQFRVTR
jgi:ribosomal protein S27AE